MRASLVLPVRLLPVLSPFLPSPKTGKAMNALLLGLLLMPFLRPLDYFENRFHDKQEDQWLAYKAGLTCVLPWGRRGGKSDFFAEVLIEDVEEYGKPCLYLASTKTSAREIMWAKFKDRIRHNRDWKLSDQRLEAIYLPADAPIRLGGIENIDDMPGKAYRIVVADEYALWKKKNTTPPEIIKMIIAPMLADYNGQIMYGSSKRGKNHFYDLHQKAKKNTSKFFVNEATVFDNPFVSVEGRKNLIGEYTDAEDPLYKQEVLNEYVTFQGKVFALEPESYTEKRWDPSELEHSYHIRGVDHGFSPDPTACLWLAWNHRRGYWLAYNEYEESKLLINQHSDVINGAEPYKISETYSDIDPQLIAEYEAVGLAMSPAGKFDKQARLLRIVNALRSGRLKIASNCTKTLKQMDAYEWNQDGDDHLIDGGLIYGFTNAKEPELLPETPYDPFPPKPVDADGYGQTFG